MKSSPKLPMTQDLLQTSPPLFGNNYGKSNFLRKSSPPFLETTMENQTSSENPHPPFWKQLWKIKLPQKILTFTWKILHYALPVKAELNRRGVHCAMACLLCNNAIETKIISSYTVIVDTGGKITTYSTYF
jgi:hypothetical protein